MATNPGQLNLEQTINSQEGGKPSRKELLERLKMAKMRGGGIHRMPKKQREEKLEQLKTVLGEQQKMVMENLRGQLTPDQLKQLGIPEGTNPNEVQIKTNDQIAEQDRLLSSATEENPITIPINIPKMSKVNTDSSTLRI